MNAFQRMNTALMVDEGKKIFKVSRQAFVDPDILTDPSTRDVRSITLSYTMFRVPETTPPTASGAPRTWAPSVN